MKKVIINENWEEVLVEDDSYFYAIVYNHNIDKAKYIKSYDTNYETVYPEFKTFISQLSDSADKRCTVYFIKLPKTEQTEKLLEKAVYKGEDKDPTIIEAVDQLLSRSDVEILETWIASKELTEARKKKRKQHRKVLGGYLVWTTGCPAYDMAQFNKHMDTNFTPSKEEKDAEKAAEQAAEAANDAIDTGATTTDAGAISDSGISEASGDIGSGESGSEGVSMGESLKLQEAKRYVKRYYVRPQNIFCSNKEEILKALVQVGDNNCSVYSLKSLADHDDVHLLKPSDIIYYYDDGVLYDKNHVKVMDYDLFVKHEEERKKVGNVDAISDSTFDKMYDDRLTDADLKDKEIKVRKPTHEELEESISYDTLKKELWTGESIYLGNNNAYADAVHNFSDGGVYAETAYYATYFDEEGIYEVTAWNMSDDGEEVEGNTEEFNNFDDFKNYVKALKLEDRQVEEMLKEDTIYVGKLGGELQLPPQIHLLPQQTVEEFVEVVDPEEEFTVGYINPIYLYKEIWEIMPIYKCTEMEGYTGVDFAQSKDNVWNDQEERVSNAKDQINLAKKTGVQVSVGSDVDYTSQNKLVNRSAVRGERNTILFYPTNVLNVHYFVKLPGNTEFMKINADQLEQFIYDNLDKIQRKFDLEKAKHKVHTTLFGETDIDIDRETRVGSSLAPKHIYKYDRDKLQVRALYTSQVYYLSAEGMTRGSKITEALKKKDLTEEAFNQNFKSVNALGEEFDDVFTCCICGEESTGYGNNPEPVRHEGRCCDSCNRKFVIPARIAQLRAAEDIEDGGEA